MIYLYLKTHNKTGLKYIGKTTKDPFKYNGSGKYWKRHLKQHGIDITTEILFQTEDKEIFKQKALDYSKKYNIVESDEYANLIDEKGDGGFTHNNPYWSLGRKQSKEERQRRSESLKKSVLFNEARKKWYDEYIVNTTEDERRKLFTPTKESIERNRKVLSNKMRGKTKDNDERVSKMAATKKNYYNSLSSEERKMKLGHSKGRKWYHNDELRLCKTFYPNDVEDGWIKGRKKYED